MALLGKAVVAIWNDITPEGCENFIEWHNRQHIPERVDIPGFLRGRRYIASQGEPEYFTLYEALDQGVLVGEEYLRRLNSPTDWTREATKEFRNTVRGVCSITKSVGLGSGGHILTARFDVPAERRDAAEELISGLLDPIAASPGVNGVHLCIADPQASGIETAERRGREVDQPNWIVMIEGSTPACLLAALEPVRAEIADQADGPVTEGIYGLEFSLVDMAERTGQDRS